MFEGQIHSIDFKMGNKDVSMIEGGITKRHYLSICKHENGTIYRTIIFIDRLLELVDKNPEYCFDHNLDLKFEFPQH